MNAEDRRFNKMRLRYARAKVRDARLAVERAESHLNALRRELRAKPGAGIRAR